MIRKKWIIWISFVISAFLQSMPWPDTIQYFRPNWILLTLLYWLLTTSYPVSIRYGFIIGLVLDLINASILGIRALAMSIVSYLVALKYWFFRNLSLLQQALFVVFISIFVDYVVFLVNLLIINVSFQPKVYCSSIVNGVLWPWFFLMMKRIQQKFFL